MRKNAMLAFCWFLVFCCLAGEKLGPTASGQDRAQVLQKDPGLQKEDQQKASEFKRVFRPKIPLQDALKIAEGYIDKQHIDIRAFWLYRVMFILSGDEKTPDEKKLPCWHFWWVNESGATDDYVEIFVDMNGHASRAPSM